MSNYILGRHIAGDVTKYGFKSVEQWDEEKFLKMVDAIFDADPELSAFNWTQYTPYFNDGEPCEFSAYVNEDAFAAFGGVPDYWGYDERVEDGLEVLSLSSMKGTRTHHEYNPNYDRTAGWDNPNSQRYIYTEVQCHKSPAYEAAQELARNFAHFEDILREHFGDHASVTATREGFNVEYYEHD